MTPPLRTMDTVAVLRGIIHAWRERVSFDHESVDVPVPLGLLMRCADEIAEARDRLHAAGRMRTEDSDGAAETPQETLDRRTGP